MRRCECGTIKVVKSHVLQKRPKPNRLRVTWQVLGKNSRRRPIKGLQVEKGMRREHREGKVAGFNGGGLKSWDLQNKRATIRGKQNSHFTRRKKTSRKAIVKLSGGRERRLFLEKNKPRQIKSHSRWEGLERRD